MSQYPPSAHKKRLTISTMTTTWLNAVHPPETQRDLQAATASSPTIPEERYWTDYLRIAAPVLGVIILLALAWFWFSHLIGGGNGAATDSAHFRVKPCHACQSFGDHDQRHATGR